MILCARTQSAALYSGHSGQSPLDLTAAGCGSSFHQQRADLVLHLHHLAHQQVAVAQRAPPLASRGRGHVARRQGIATQSVANLVAIDAIVLFLRHGNGPQHRGVRHFQRGSVRLEMIVDPAGEYGHFRLSFTQ